MKNRQQIRRLFLLATGAGGTAAVAWSAAHLNTSSLDLAFLILFALTLAVGTRFGVRIPRVSGEITIADTFTFLTMLLYGGDAAVLLAAAEGLLTSARVSRRPSTYFFNWGLMALSVFLASRAASLFFGDLMALRRGGFSPHYLGALVTIVLVHYLVNSGLIAASEALKIGETFFKTWRENYLWTSLTFFAGASAAGVIARAVDYVGFYAALGVLPVVAFVYLTYLTYQRNILASHERAELAQRHVEELSHYIAEQERIREQFSQVEKLSALGVLSSGVAHNFNNTLASILARAELMLTQTSDPGTRRGLEIILKSAEDGAKTVKRIQDFARQRKGHDFRTVAVEQLLHDVAEITRPRWKDAAEAAAVYISMGVRGDGRAFVSGDESELREVLVNMVFNAVDAMPGGGTLTLSTRESGGAVEITVADTGTGMTEEVRARVFDPFFTTKGVGGMGLGLAVSYGTVARHGGSIEVDSAVGLGTTFRIKLPAAEAPRDGAARREASGGDTFQRLKMVKILVVDDEQPVRQLLCEILAELGCETAQAASGCEALALFDAGRFDAVFTDIGMPGMSGWELARSLRERAPRMPLAVITGWGETVSDSQRQEARINWLVSKPFSMARIMQVGEEVVALCETAAPPPVFEAEAEPCGAR